MSRFQEILKGGDLRSVGRVNEIIAGIKTRQEFDQLFQGLNHTERTVVMRTADAIEKITQNKAEFLQPHKAELLKLCRRAKDIELKWHLALLVPRLAMTMKELEITRDLLYSWASDKGESKIVRVNSIQGLFELLAQNPGSKKDFIATVSELKKENIPSLNARIRKLLEALG